MKKYLLLSMFFLCCISFSYSTYTASFYETTRSTSGNTSLSTIRTLVREEIQDPTNSYGTNRYTDTKLDRYINIIHEDISLQTHCLHTTATGYLVAGTTSYYLPLNCISIERVIFDTDTLLAVKNPYEMDEVDTGWFDASVSSPTAWYRFPGYEQISFYPAPKYSNGYIKIWYIKKPTALSSDTDEIFDSIPALDVYRRAIVVGVAYILFLQENDPRANTKFQEYAQYLDTIRRLFDMNPTYVYKGRTYKK